jgi:M6 family metalloprotease-like protein
MVKINQMLLLIALMMISIVGSIYAMPPYQGMQEPPALKAMKLKGLDSPQDGLIQQLQTKDSSAKISGSREYPVVMGYFTDLDSINTSAEFQTMLFSNSTETKSVNNYYRDMSYNAMSCSGSVAKWVTSGNTVAYFGDGTNGFTNGTTNNVYEFIRAVLANSDATVDFSNPEYDLNHDGYVDVLWVVHAGRGGEEATANDIWSHSWSLSYWSGGTYYITNDISSYTGNPVRINKYIIMPERTKYADGNTTTTEMIGAGVFAHEFGHALGLPDLYDTGTPPSQGGVAGSGVGLFSLMAAGSWGGDYISGATPVSLDVWCKRFLGWLTPLTVTTNSLYTVNSTLANSANSSYKLSKGGSDTTRQYWLIENRWKTAIGPVSNVAWDANLRGQGLGIYHIDSTYTTTTYINNNNVNNNSTDDINRNRPLGVALEETDETTAGYSSELWYGNNYGESVDIWNSGNQTSFDSSGTSYPVAYYNGTNSTTAGSHAGVAVRQIPAASAVMSCSLIVKPAGAPTGPDMDLDHASYSVNVPQNDSLDQTLVIGNNGDMDLEWNLTYNSTGTVNYDNADYGTAIGNGGVTFITAALFTGTELSSYYETYELYAVRALIVLPVTNVTLKVWQGGTTSPTTEIYSEDVTSSTADGWNTYTLSTPITLQTGVNYWIGYSVGHASGEYPASVDNGPAIDGKGDWVYDAGWAELQTYGLDYNWNLKMLLGKKLSDWITINPSSGTVSPAGTNDVTFKFDATGLALGTYSDTVCLANNDLANNPKKIPVSMTVEATGIAGKPHTDNPAVFALNNAWPNPAKGQVNFKYQLPRTAKVDLKVYNVLGQMVKQFDLGMQNPGYYSVKWDDKTAAEGVYFIRLQAGNYQSTRKFVMVK